MAQHQFSPNDIIFHEGDPAQHVFCIVAGQIELIKQTPDGEMHIATLNPGEVIGESSLFEVNSTYNTSARAITEAVLDVMDLKEFDALLEQCNPRLVPVLRLMTNHMRSIGNKHKAKESASPHTLLTLDSGIERITVKPASDTLSFHDLNIPLSRLPFRIGAYGPDGPNSRNRYNHLNIGLNSDTMLISRQHGQVEIIDNALFFTDLGSRYTTLVNGKYIGRGKGVYSAPLQAGENEIILGGVDSPHKILILCV